MSIKALGTLALCAAATLNLSAPASTLSDVTVEDTVTYTITTTSGEADSDTSETTIYMCTDDGEDMLLKYDEETGEVLESTDGGTTWRESDVSLSFATEEGAENGEVIVTVTSEVDE